MNRGGGRGRLAGWLAAGGGGKGYPRGHRRSCGHTCHILPPSEIDLGLCLAVLQAQKGNIYFTELAERVEYGKYGGDITITIQIMNISIVLIMIIMIMIIMIIPMLMIIIIARATPVVIAGLVNLIHHST